MSTFCEVPGCFIHAVHDGCDDGTCQGCKRKTAVVGVLCQWHWNRLLSAVAEHNTLITHLREIGQPYAQVAPLTSDIAAHGDPAEGTVLPAAWLAADELAADLAGWAHAWLDENDDRWPNREPWNGDVALWTQAHLRVMAGAPWAAEFVTEYVGSVETLHHRWPTAQDVEQPHKVKAIPCPRCGLMSLLYTPPRGYRMPFVVECTDPDCARTFSEDEWERLVMLVERERA